MSTFNGFDLVLLLLMLLGWFNFYLQRRTLKAVISRVSRNMCWYEICVLEPGHKGFHSDREQATQ